MNIYLCLFAEYREFDADDPECQQEFAGDADGGTSMDRGVIGSCWRNGTFGGVIGFLRISAVVDCLHLCICINTYHNRNDGRSMVSTGVAIKMVPGFISRRWNANFWLYFTQASPDA